MITRRASPFPRPMTSLHLLWNAATPTIPMSGLSAYGVRAGQSGQEVGKTPKPQAGSHGAYARLRRRIQSNTRKYFGSAPINMFVLRIQAHGRRGWFDLEPDLESAVKKARKLKEYLKLNGWAATLREYKYSADHESVRLTVADYIDLVAKHGCLDDKTVAGYAAAFRRIVGAIEKVPGTGRSKFSGGRKPSSWRKAVDLIDLNRITPAAVMEWRSTYMKGPGADSSRKVNAEHTVNTVIRTPALSSPVASCVASRSQSRI